jgi:hypothetical protein
MNTSVADILLGRVKSRLDEVAPAVGGSAILDTLGLLVEERLARGVPGQARGYVQRLLGVLETPLPRILVSGWRKYEEFLKFALPSEDRAAHSGKVDLLDYEVKANWELAPRLAGKVLAGPRLLVGLTLGFALGTVEVRDARFVAMEAGALTYQGFLRVKDATKDVASVGPGELAIPGERLDFGDGWPVKPW